MKTKIKTLYYCDFCGKRGFQKSRMEKHEQHCTLNSHRQCGMCKNENAQDVQNYLNMITTSDKEYFQSVEFIEELKKQVYCPNCILTILRCSGIQNFNFDYKESLKKYWAEINEEETRRDALGLLYG